MLPAASQSIQINLGQLMPFQFDASSNLNITVTGMTAGNLYVNIFGGVGVQGNN
jgi:hypothetical protein